MIDNFKEFVRHCDICHKAKYDRKQTKIPIGEAPIPSKEGEFLHIDIFYAQKFKFLICIDAYSKFLVIKQIEDKTNLGEKILDILQTFPAARKITLDNEPGFKTPTFQSLMQRLRIQLYFADPRHSTTNGQIERAKSTVIEIARCLKEEYHLLDT
ncbi:hypothetical protein DOY81_008108 [Sarcophaga bullata]|nr:hypothetical protein DOY81_008108 [Sarcophaga bullata]